MKKTMSVISVILSLAMLLGLLPVMGLTAFASGTDLYAGKGSFATDTVADMFAAESATAEIPFTYAGNVAGPDGQLGVASMNLFQGHHYTKAVPIEGGKKYTIRFKVQLNDADASTALGLYFYINDSVTQMSNMNPLESSYNYKGLSNEALGNGWYQVTATHLASTGATTMKISLNPRTTWAEGDTIYVDDITIAEHEHSDTTGDHLCDTPYMCDAADSGFPWTAGNSFAACGETLPLPENGDLYYGDGTASTQTAFNNVFPSNHYTYASTVNGPDGNPGVASMNIFSDKRAFKIATGATAGAMYTISFKMQVNDNAGDGITIYAYVGDTTANCNNITVSNVTYSLKGVVRTDLGNNWKQYDVTYKAEGDSIYFALNAASSTATTGDTIYVDDVSITPHKHSDTTGDYKCDAGCLRDGTNDFWSGWSNTCDADMSAFAGAQGVLGEEVRLDLYVGTSLTGLTVELDADEFTANKAQTETSIAVVDGKVSVKFPAKNMADEFTATLKNDETVLDTITYSVKKYAEAVIADGDSSAAEVAAAKAMLNYGAAAQVEFNYNTSVLANAGLDAADQTVSADDIVGVPEEGIDLTNLVVNPDMEGTGGYHGYGTDPELVDSGSAAHGKVLHITGAGQNKSVLLNGAMDMNVPYYVSFQLKSTTEAGGSTEGTYDFARLGIANTSYSPYQSIGDTKSSITDADGYYTYTAKFTLTASYATPALIFQINTGNTSHYYIDNVVVRRQSEEEQANLYRGGALDTYQAAKLSFGQAMDATYGEVETVTIAQDFSTNGANVMFDFTATEAGKTYVLSYDAKLTSTEKETFTFKPLAYNGNTLVTDGISGKSVGSDWTHCEFEFTGANVNRFQLRFTTAMTANEVVSIANIKIIEKVEEAAPIDSYLATLTGYAGSEDVFVGFTLVLRDTTTVRLYFNEEVTACSATGYTTGSVVSGGTTMYYVELPAVKASGLDTVSDLTVTTASGTVTLENFSALSPAALVIKADNDANLAKLCTALVLYAEAVNALA